MGNENSVGHIVSVPEDVLRERLLPMLLQERKGYQQLHLVCKRSHQLLTQWAHCLPKKTLKDVFQIRTDSELILPRYLHFEDQYCEIQLETGRTSCTNFTSESDSEPSLATMLQHIYVPFLVLFFGPGCVVTDSLLQYLVDECLVSFQEIQFNTCDLSHISEFSLQTFLHAVVEAGTTSDLRFRDTLGPLDPNQSAITDQSLQEIVRSPRLQKFTLQYDFDTDDSDVDTDGTDVDPLRRITNVTLFNLATNFPPDFCWDFQYLTAPQFTLHDIASIVQAWLACPTSPRGSILVPNETIHHEELKQLLPPCDDVEKSYYYSQFYYERSYGVHLWVYINSILD